MTLEEAKDILLKLESLVSKTNRIYKKGERMDSAPFLKLHRKRISMFDVQEEAEIIFHDDRQACRWPVSTLLLGSLLISGFERFRFNFMHFLS